NTPCDVDTIAVPKPFSTRGTSSALANTRNPGLLILLIPVMTLSLFNHTLGKFSKYLVYHLLLPHNHEHSLHALKYQQFQLLILMMVALKLHDALRLRYEYVLTYPQ